MIEIHVPEVDELSEQLGLLIGKEIKADSHEEPWEFGPSVQSAIYVTRDDRLAAILRMDLPLAAHVGAALAMMPASASEEAAKEGVLEDDLLDAFGEVVNIMAALLCLDGAPHVRLATVNHCEPSLEADFMSALVEPEVRINLALEVEGYGSGRMTWQTRRIAEVED
ncbi:MAG: hypothetical protein AB8G23_20665 [Myxococcota bacterium]